MNTEKRPHNTGLAKVAVQCSADTFVVNQTLVLRINICGENRHLRQARKRWRQLLPTRVNRPTMKKYLLTILLKTFGTSLAITLLLLTILLIGQQTDNNNLHFNATGMIYGISVSILLGLTLSSSTVFFNMLRKARKNIFQSFLAFTLLPIIVTIVLLALSLPVSGFPFWISCSITLPYLVTIGYHFFNFRRTFHQVI
ncbi:hypothetical protein ACFOWA_11690 [Pedobacter lithocola]|uniref:DUF1189 domain-containing protein n=1 Tax=Pedobacter lithocola TaxID=1908239 RepID=A0ABV8PCK0_9SPHI